MVCNGLGYTLQAFAGLGLIFFLVTWFLLGKLIVEHCKLHSQVADLKRKVKRLEESQE